MLSSFANPQTRETQLELGDMFVYRDSLRPAITKAYSREENGALPCSAYDLATLSISANYVLNFCLSALGIASVSSPLTNRYSQEEYDLSAGYVAVINELLLSESFVGYLDYNEVLQIQDLDAAATTGPLLTNTDILALSPIGTGALPGEAIVVSYASRKLKQSVTDGQNSRAKQDYGYSYGEYIRVEERDEIKNTTVSYSWQTGGFYKTYFDAYGRAYYRYQEVKGFPGPKRTSQRWSYRKEAPIPGDGTEPADTCIVPPETEAQWVVSEETSITSGPVTDVIKACGFPAEIYATTLNMPGYSITLEKSKTIYTKYQDTTKTVSTSHVPFVFTSIGAEVTRKAVAANTGLLTAAIIFQASSLVQVSQDVRIRSEDRYGVQQAPLQVDLNTKPGSSPDQAPTEVRLAWVYGAPTSTSVTRFTMPKVPDEWYTWSGGTTYSWNPSFAQQKALKFGRIQNAMLLGNRQGMGIQCSPLKLPPNPFDSIYIQLGGFSAQYRCNGLQWNINATDVIASTDAMLWGAVGAASGVSLATSWVPLAPSVTSLPTPPAATADATYGSVMTPAIVAPPYDETIQNQGVIRLYWCEPDQIYPYYGLCVTGTYDITGKASLQPIETVNDTGTYEITGRNSLQPIETINATGTYSITGNDA